MTDERSRTHAKLIWPTQPGLVVPQGHEHREEFSETHPALVVVDPEVLGGKACLAGSRLPAETLLACVDAGNSWDSIVASWPWLTPGHVEAAQDWRRRYG